jgi:tetratricopeptide (TPR) repeat protein
LAASDALLKLKTPLNAPENTTPPPASAYLKIAQEYSGTAAADRAGLLAAGALFSENKFTEAQAQFNKFIRDRPQSPFAPIAAYGVAACLEALGKQDEALASYQNLSVRYPNSSVLDDAKLSIARLYEAKKMPELALRAYDELMKSAAAGGMANAVSEAMARREDLVAKHPELAKTNAVPAAATGPTTLVIPNTNLITALSNSPALKTSNSAPVQH